MAYADRDILLSPHCIVRFAGFESTGALMTRCGWEFAVEQGALYGEMRVLMRHRALDLMAVGRSRVDPWVSASLGSRYRDAIEQPIIVVDRVAAPSRIEFVMLNPDDFLAVSMVPNRVIRSDGIRGDRIDLFSPPESKEILIAPESVAELMDRIQKLQQPELQAIRERNRRRAARDALETGGERGVANIIAIAA